MVKYQPVFLLCLAYLSHIVSGAAVVNTDQLDKPVRLDSPKVDVPRNLLKRGGSGDKGYGRLEVDKSQDGDDGYEDFDDNDNDNEWDNEWYNNFDLKPYYDGESSDEQEWNWPKKEGWVNEPFNDANTASCPAPGTTTITATATATANDAANDAAATTTTTITTTTTTSISTLSECTTTTFATTTVPGPTVTSTETETIIGFTTTIPTTTTSIISPTVTIFIYSTLPCP